MYNHKDFHASNLYEDKLLRSSKKGNSNKQQGTMNSASKKKPETLAMTEPSPYEEQEKIYRQRGVPSNVPLEKPSRDTFKGQEVSRPTENPAFFLKEKEMVESKKKGRDSRNASLEEKMPLKNSLTDNHNLNNNSASNFAPTTTGKFLLENEAFGELNTLRTRVKALEEIEGELEESKKENERLREELSSLNSLKQREFEDVLRKFEEFRNKIKEVEAQNEYFKGLNREYLSEKNTLRLESQEKIYDLESRLADLTLKHQDCEKRRVAKIEEPPKTEEKNAKIIEERDKLRFELQSRDLELGVWKSKYFELQESKTANARTVDPEEVSSMKIQTKELMDKIVILNRIIESNAVERENLETELRIYKQKLGENERKIQENIRNSNVGEAAKEKAEKESMKKKIIEDEKRILTLISEFEKLSAFASQQEQVIAAQESTIRDLKGKAVGQMRNSKGFIGKSQEAFSDKNAEKEKVIQAMEDQIEALKTELENSLGWRKKNEETISLLMNEKNHLESEISALRNDLAARDKEIEGFEEQINEQNNSIKRLTELGDIRQSLCVPKSENRLSYSFGEEDADLKAIKGNSKLSVENYEKLLVSNRSYFMEEKGRRVSGDTDNFSRPFKI